MERTLVRPDGEPATPLARWLDAIGPIGDFEALLDRYRSETGRPATAEGFRAWLWRDAGVAVNPSTGALVLPDDWPVAPARPH